MEGKLSHDYVYLLVIKASDDEQGTSKLNLARSKD